MQDSPTPSDVRLQLLESRAAIADVVHRYAFNIRTLNAEAIVDLFTEDAVFEMREASAANPAGASVRTLQGRQEIIGFLTGAEKSGVRVFPEVYNLLIEIDGAHAQGSALMTARMWPEGQEIRGEYRDSFRHEAGWRFSRRTHTILKYAALAQ